MTRRGKRQVQINELKKEEAVILCLVSSLHFVRLEIPSRYSLHNQRYTQALLP